MRGKCLRCCAMRGPSAPGGETTDRRRKTEAWTNPTNTRRPPCATRGCAARRLTENRGAEFLRPYQPAARGSRLKSRGARKVAVAGRRGRHLRTPGRRRRRASSSSGYSGCGLADSSRRQGGGLAGAGGRFWFGGRRPGRCARRGRRAACPLACWFRLQRAVENTPTALVVLEQEPFAKTCASLVLGLEAEAAGISGFENRNSKLHSTPCPAALGRPARCRGGNGRGRGGGRSPNFESRISRSELPGQPRKPRGRRSC